MTPLPRRALLAVAAVTDVALHARPAPVASRALADRRGLAPRRLETILQALVRAGVLKSVRGPRGGYELARERRRVSVGAIVRAVGREADEEGEALADPLLEAIAPALAGAGEAYLRALDEVTIEDLCRAAAATAPAGDADFAI